MHLALTDRNMRVINSMTITVLAVCRVPEEAPQEIADLVFQCTGQPEERPSAADCADIIRYTLLTPSSKIIFVCPLDLYTLFLP